MASNLEARNILQGLFDKWNKPSEEKQTVSTPQELYQLSFYKNGKDRIMAKFGSVYLCTCEQDEKDKVVSDFNKYKKGGYSTLDIKRKLREDYSLSPSESGKRGGKPKHKKKVVPQAPMKWTDNGKLLFYGKETNITPYNLDIICSLHANYDNPFTFGDYVLQNLPRALPSAVFYLCENYDMIPKLSSEGKKILDKR